MECKFYDLCANSDVDCEFCCHNPEAVTQSFFVWNEEGEEPTQEELDEEMY